MSSAGTTEGGRTVCYLTKRFPRLSETFILDEILGLEANGVDLCLFAIADPREATVQPDVRRVRSTVTYLRTGDSTAAAVRDNLHFVHGHVRLLAHHPVRWTRTAARLLGPERSRAMARHFLEAGGMALEMDRVGGDHLHAAFAHGPASTAYYVHLVTGRPYSFAAHAKDLYLSTPEVLAAKIVAASFVLACSHSAAAELRRIAVAHGGSGAEVIYAPHGVDVDRFRPGPEGSDATDRTGLDEPVRLLTVGRLVPKKGYPTLVSALAELADRGVPFTCRIIGGGDLREALAARLASAGIADRVELCGTRTQIEILEEYRQADLFVQASVVTADGDRDGIPNSVLEAMSCGLAVVATDVAGIPEVITDHGTGLLARQADPTALADALGEAVDDHLLRARLGRAAREFVIETFSRSDCVRLPAALLEGRALTGDRVAAVVA
jgi:glycosyltransferase involved in cell wall biosynthesis